MGLLHAAHLVITQSVELVVRDRRHLRLELIQPDGDVAVRQFLDGDGIGLVVHKHVGVDAYVHKVNHIVVHQRALVGNAVKPAALKTAAKTLNKLASPYLCQHAGLQSALRGELTKGNSCQVGQHCANHGIDTKHQGNSNAHHAVEQKGHHCLQNDFLSHLFVVYWVLLKCFIREAPCHTRPCTAAHIP